MKRILSNIVLFASGVDVKFLKENSPGEKGKYYPIGLGVLITTLLGFISMMFATHAIFAVNSLWEEIPLILFSIFWAFAIFTIDWGLVKTMKKARVQNWKTVLASIFSVIFRLGVAILLSYTISKPMEVKIYEKRLTAQIEKDRQEFVQRELEKRTKETKLIDANITSILDKNTDVLKTQSEGPKSESYTMNTAALKSCLEETKILKSKNDIEISNLQSERSKLWNKSSDRSWETYFELVDSIQVEKRRMKSWAKNRSYLIQSKLIPALNKEVEQKKESCGNIDKRVQSADSLHAKTFGAVTNSLSNRLEQTEFDRALKLKQDSLAILEITKASFVSFDPVHPGLITQVESMSTFEETPEGKSASMVRLLLLLVIIAIDTAPIVIKLLTKRTIYDDLKDMEQDKIRSLANSENIANKNLVTELSKAQKQVLNKAVEDWKNKEMNDENMHSKYINNDE